MQVVKKLNNNAAICIDSSGNELVAIGKGIGFPSLPYTLEDLSKIDATYYNVSPEQEALLAGIPESILSLSEQIIEYAHTKLNADFNPNLALTLADHISFSIERYRKGQHIKMPNASDLAVQYPIEMEIGRKGLKLINSQEKIGLGKEEAVSLALHFINAEVTVEDNGELSLNRHRISDNILYIIEEECNVKIDRDGFNCSRFLNHLSYLYGRIESHTSLQTKNSLMFETMVKDYPEAYSCAEKIAKYFKSVLNYELEKEDILYLMIHINRLCTREIL